jgi:glutamate/tyrosine decarboxylase-like PLP-dependent enzyme
VGVDGYRSEITRQVALAAMLRNRVEARPALELVADGPLSIVCFRVRTPTDSPATADAVNRAVSARLQSDGRVFITTTVIRGVVALRACVVNFRTREQDLDVLLNEVEAAARAVAAGD